MDYYKVRIDLTQCNIKDIESFIMEVSPTTSALVREKQDTNPHVHLYIESPVPGRTLRSKLRKLAGSGNGRYSLKTTEEKPIEYLAYMLKEGKPCFTGLSKELLEEVYNYDIKVKKDLLEKKENKKTQIQKIESYMRANPLIAKRIEGDKIDQRMFVQIVVEWFKESGTLFREFQVISLAQTLYLKYNSRGKTDLIERVLDKMGYTTK